MNSIKYLNIEHNECNSVKEELTVLTPRMSRPRAATSVATKTSISSSLNLFRASNLCGWVRFP